MANKRNAAKHAVVITADEIFNTEDPDTLAEIITAHTAINRVIIGRHFLMLMATGKSQNDAAKTTGNLVGVASKNTVIRYGRMAELVHEVWTTGQILTGDHFLKACQDAAETVKLEEAAERAQSKADKARKAADDAKLTAGEDDGTADPKAADAADPKVAAVNMANVLDTIRTVIMALDMAAGEDDADMMRAAITAATADLAGVVRYMTTV